MDSVGGTGGNDTIVAGSQAGLATLTSGDQINGGAGTDTLQLYGNTNATNFTGAAVSNVEVVTALFDATGGALNVAGNSGVTSVNVGNSTVTNAAGTGAITVTLAKAQAAGITGTILNDTTTSAAGNNANVTFAFSDVTGGADSATLNVNNAKFAKNAANVLGAGSGVTIAGVETLNIAATGTNALGNLLIADTTKLVITGAGSLSATLSQAAGVTKTIDGSAATGNLTIDNKAAAAAVESIKTGSGNDVYTTQFLNLTKDDVIDLGTGTDSLRFSDAATINSTASAAALVKVTGVEQLGTVGTALTIDGDFVSQTSYYTSGGGSVVLSNIANNADVTLATGVIGASSVGMKLGANTLNVNLTGSTAAADATAGLTVTGSATVNVKSSGVDGVANNVLALTAADNQSVVVTGSQNLTLTATAATGTTGFSIDGSAFTGKLTVTGTAATDIVKGGSGNDTISGGAGAVSDTLTGGAGADTFVLTTGLTGITATGAEVITDFVTKSDILKVGIAGSATTYTEATAAVADFTAALAAANAALTPAGGVQINAQQVGSDVWVFVDSNDSGAINAGDVVVKLVGVSLAGIEAGDFIV